MILEPSLRLLLVLKARGKIRKQVRRLRSPKGILLALVGVVLIGAWFGTLTLGWTIRSEPIPVEQRDLFARVAAMALMVMTVTASFNHRGVYMPAEELERLLAAPISRSSLIRYRLVASLGRYAFSGIVFGLVCIRQLPHAGFAFFGVLLFMLTLPIVGQFAALVAGGLELRFGRLMKRSRLRYLHLLVFGLLGIGFMVLMFGDEFAVQFSSLERLEGLTSVLLESSILRTLVSPFTPWAEMVTARTAGEFFPWFGICLALWALFFRITAAIPFDFRELTLETSADVARRIRRVQRTGFGASAGKASTSSFGRRIPWLFGRSPAGAMAWLKLAAIMRKTRGTVTISILIVALMTAASLLIFSKDTPKDILGGAFLVALLGTIYLCAGLRFDFRTDLDQMEAIKSWPISPRRAFLANLLPEVLLVSSLISAAIVIRIVVSGAFHAALLGLLAGIPFIALAWIALDNAVFLIAPVRNIAGQEGMLQHMGRSMVLVILRALFAGVVFGFAGTLGYLAWIFSDSSPEELRIAMVASVAAACLFVADCGLVYFGGWALRRFDVSSIPR